MAQAIDGPKINPNDVSPLNLAFIGDSVYETIIRTKVLVERNSNLKDVNLRANRYTTAKAQSRMAVLIEDKLSDHERSIFKRGRNAKSVSAPKSCTIGEYRHATGFESLIGYLYLEGNIGRLQEIIELATDLYDMDIPF